jgi:hypothetical protein
LKIKAKKEKRLLVSDQDGNLVSNGCNSSKNELIEFEKQNNFVNLENGKESVFYLTQGLKAKEIEASENSESNKIRNSNRNVSSFFIGNLKKDLEIKNNNHKIKSNIKENFSSDDIENTKNKKQLLQKNKQELFEMKAAPQPPSYNKNQPLSNKEYLTSTLKATFSQEILHHQFSMIFINFSLGIQFFSLINIFPHLHYNYTYSVLTEEIFFSKLIHLILLFFFPLLFLIKKLTRKSLLLFAFCSNFIINLLVLINFINSTAFVHTFRFIWNICYITTNLYNCEAAPFKIRYLNTSIMNLFFKISCMIEIIIIERLINVDLFLPVAFNLFILLMDNLLVSKLEYETHFKSLEQIKLELN